MKLTTFVRTFFLATATVTVVSSVALADSIPSYATKEETIKGTISSVEGKYKILVRDDRGYVDTVSLHDGTVINPNGLTLASGQTVTILGHNAGSTFRANEIDTPYHTDYATEAGFGYVAPYAYPTYPYYGAYGYGYPGYGYGYGYPGYYGSVGIFFGGGYYGRGYYGHGYYGGRGYGYGGRGYAGFPGHGGYIRGGLAAGRGVAGVGGHGGGGHGHR